MPPPETYKREIGSQSTMCQVHAGAYVSLLAPGKTDYTACHPRLPRIYYTWYLSLRIRTTNASKLAKRNKGEKGKEMGALGQEKEKVNKFWGATGESATTTMPRGFLTIYSSTTNEFRYTHRSTDYRRITRDRRLAVVVTCLCVGGACALPLDDSCLGITCGVLDGLTAATHQNQNVRSYDVSFLQEMLFFSLSIRT